MIPLFGKEGLGEIFIILCDGHRHERFYFPNPLSPLQVVGRDLIS